MPMASDRHAGSDVTCVTLNLNRRILRDSPRRHLADASGTDRGVVRTAPLWSSHTDPRCRRWVCRRRTVVHEQPGVTVLTQTSPQGSTGDGPTSDGPTSDVPTAEVPTDDVLTRRAVLGDRIAFAQIVDQHGAVMFRYALRMLGGDHQGAEDAVQEALIDAWVNLPGFRAESSLRTWLLRLCANRVLASRRRQRPVAVDDQLLSAQADSAHHGPAAQVLQGELWETLDLALSELPYRQRASWLLREVEGLGYDDIASILGTTPTVVRGQLHRARRALAIRMEQWR